MKMEDVTNGESLFPNFDPTAALHKSTKQRTNHTKKPKKKTT